VTVNEELFTVWPFTVTTKGPDEAPAGTMATMLLSVQFAAATLTAFSEIVLISWVAPKWAPEIVTKVPTIPDCGDRPLMLGVCSTVKLTPLLSTPLTLTTTFPVIAPVGTGTAIDVVLQLVGVVAVPLNATVLAPCDDPKFVPSIVTNAPTVPDVGERVVILGSANETPDKTTHARTTLARRHILCSTVSALNQLL
jgi:hypothetical protein